MFAAAANGNASPRTGQPSSKSAAKLNQNVLHDMTFDIREPEIPASVAIRKLLVIKSELV